jgi:hypothetical protein
MAVKADPTAGYVTRLQQTATSKPAFQHYPNIEEAVGWARVSWAYGAVSCTVTRRTDGRIVWEGSHR